MQYFKPFTHLGKSTHGNSLKAAQFCWKKRGLGNQELQKSDFIDHRSRIRRDDWKDHAWVFAAQQILSSLTNIWSCKMCSLYTECLRSRNRTIWEVKYWSFNLINNHTRNINKIINIRRKDMVRSASTPSSPSTRTQVQTRTHIEKRPMSIIHPQQ